MALAPEHPHTADQAIGWTGARVDAIDDGSIGRVEGIYLDAESGEPAWLIFRIGRLGRRTAVPFEFAAAGAGSVWLPFEKDRLKRLPEVDPAAGMHPALERKLCAHLGIPEGGWRLGVISGRAEEQPSAIPAPV